MLDSNKPFTMTTKLQGQMQTWFCCMCAEIRCRRTQVSEFALFGRQQVHRCSFLVHSSSLSHYGLLSICHVEMKKCYAEASGTASPRAEGKRLQPFVGRFCFHIGSSPPSPILKKWKLTFLQRLKQLLYRSYIHISSRPDGCCCEPGAMCMCICVRLEQQLGHSGNKTH